MLRISNHGNLVIFEHVLSSHFLVLEHQCIMISEEAHFQTFCTGYHMYHRTFLNIPFELVSHQIETKLVILYSYSCLQNKTVKTVF